MPSTLLEHQHELLYPDGSSALLFGTEATGYLTLTPPQIEALDGTLGDLDRPREDGRAFGEDYRGAKTLSFEMGVLTDRHGYADVYAANLDAIDRIESVWDSPKFRSTPGKIGVMRSRAGGTTWRCYGRPRNLGEATGMFTSKGYTPITAEFALADSAWYSDTKTVESVTITPPEAPGLIGPLKAPLTTQRIMSSYGIAAVGGSRPTWPVVTIFGPVTNPLVKIGPLTIDLDLKVPEGNSLTIDPRPWQRTVLRNDGATFAGSLTANSTLMRAMTLAPGTYEIRYDGIDGTGTSRVQVEWRDARARP